MKTPTTSNNKIIAEFRANDGRVGGPLAGTPLMLVHHIGAKSGIERVTPLAHNPQHDRRFVIVASNGGAPTHPGWYHNLKANPRSEVEAVPRGSRFWRKCWKAPPALRCGRRWSRRLPP
jgi:deazaflavin-dependent oxidoreductase (nitroreductase family)